MFLTNTKDFLLECVQISAYGSTLTLPTQESGMANYDTAVLVVAMVNV